MNKKNDLKFIFYIRCHFFRTKNTVGKIGGLKK